MNPYTSYYLNQVGSGLPGFQGIRYQRGHGFFGRLFSNTLLPFFKSLLPAVGKRVLPSAIGLAQDVVAGENVGKSALSRLKEAGRSAADETLDQLKTRIQKGSGRKRKRRTKKITNKKPNVNKKRTSKRRKKKSVQFDFLK